MKGFGELIYPFAVEPTPNQRFCVIPFNFTLSANSSSSSTYRISKGWDFVLVIVNSYSTGAFSLQIRDDEATENLFTADVRGALVSGNGQESFILPKFHKFPKGGSITVSVRDLSAASNTIQLALIGYKETLIGREITVSKEKPPKLIPAGEKYLIEKFYVIPFDFTMAGLTYTDSYPISKDYVFIWDILNAYSAREFTIQIRDEYMTEDFFVSAVRSSVITGNGQNPFVLPRPYLFIGGTTIKVTITDTDPAGASTPVQIAFIGYKGKKI